MLKIDETDKLIFPKEFFLDEVREGFYVPAMMKRAWAAQLAVVNVVGRICKKHGINYYADSGSLLGAIRHGGFIPWDDDFDLCMLREDYDRFYEAAKTELPEGYRLLEIRSDSTFDDLLMRIVNTDNFNFNEDFLDRYSGFPFPAGVDIFPLDNLYDEEDRNKEEARIKKLKPIEDVFNLFKEEADERKIRKALSMVESINHTTIKRNGNITYSLLTLQDKLYRENTDNTTKNVAMMPYFVRSNGKGHIYERSIFKETVYIPFECFLIPAPARFDRVTEVEYGNFMNIRHAWGTHEFPYYGWMQDALSEANGADPYRYNVTTELFLNILDVQEEKKAGIREKGEGEKKEVLFLPWKKEGFDAIKGLYERYLKDPDINVKLSYMPYKDKNPLGDTGETGDPEALNDSSVFSKHYDEIIITQPFDNMCFTAEFPGEFIVESLYNRGDIITLVPYLVPTYYKDDTIKQQSMLRDYLITPGFFVSDRILVPNEDIRTLFSDVLSENMEKLIGVSKEDSKEFWEFKIQVSEDIKRPDISSPDREGRLCPDKKSIVYFISMTSLIKYGEKAIEKIKRSKEIFYENRDSINLLFVPESILEGSISQWDEVLNEIEPELLKEWEELLREFDEYSVLKNDDGRDPVGLIKELAASCDAFYGDPGYAAHVFREYKKPVMIQNVDV